MPNEHLVKVRLAYATAITKTVSIVTERVRNSMIVQYMSPFLLK